MLTISSLSEKFNTINTDKIIDESLNETKDEFKAINKQQLKSGKTRTGEEIKSTTNPNTGRKNYYKSKKYALAKNQMNALPGLGNPDLYLTGAFYEGIDVEVGKDVFDIISKDEKGPELENKYSDIFGLGNNFKKKYLDEDLGPTVKKKISNFVGLKFQ